MAVERAIAPPPVEPFMSLDKDEDGEPVISDSFEHRRHWDILAKLLLKQETYEVTINPASVPAQSTIEHSVAVVGLSTQDIITVTKPTYTAGFGIGNARSNTKDTLNITFFNCTTSAINAPEEKYLVLATRR